MVGAFHRRDRQYYYLLKYSFKEEFYFLQNSIWDRFYYTNGMDLGTEIGTSINNFPKTIGYMIYLLGVKYLGIGYKDTTFEEFIDLILRYEGFDICNRIQHGKIEVIDEKMINGIEVISDSGVTSFKKLLEDINEPSIIGSRKCLQ